MSKNTREERLTTLQAQPLVPESGTSGRSVSAQPEAPKEISSPEACVVEVLLAANVELEGLKERQASTLKSTKVVVTPVRQTSSALSNLSVAVVLSTSIEANVTRSQASTLNLTDGAVDPIPRPSSAQPNLPVVIMSPLTSNAVTPRWICFSPAKPFFLGSIGEPEGPPSCVGGYSDVWRCRVRFSAPSETLPQAVAVKVLRSIFLGDCGGTNVGARLMQRLKQETRTWNGLDHPNIVPLVGWTEGPSLSLISPWYEQGNLNRHLNSLPEFKKIRLLLGIAKGLEYLHSRTPPVVHGDLKPENILLSDEGEPLLTDFGLSTIIGEEDMYTFSHRVGGSTPWMSPECMMGELRSCQSDIYSFGSLAFTVMTGVSPHAGLNHNQITLKVCNENDPKNPVEDWSKYPQLQGPVGDLLKECWARSPNARPPMSAAVRRLIALLEFRELGTPAISSEPEPKKGSMMIWLCVAAVIFVYIGMTICN